MVKYIVIFKANGQEYVWRFAYAQKFDPEKAEVFVWGEIKACLEAHRVNPWPDFVEDIIVLYEHDKDLVWRKDVLDLHSASLD